MQPCSNTVLAIIGMPGCGKSTAASCLSSMEFPVIRMGELTDQRLREKKMAGGETNEKKVRDDLRQKFGQDIYARKTIKKIKQALLKQKLVIIDGLRTLAEYNFYKNNLKNFKTVFISARQKIRYERLNTRKIRPLKIKDAEERDINEKTTFEIDLLEEISDYSVTNNGNYESLRKKMIRLVKKQ